MRNPSPVRPGARARLETIRQPLYDSAVFDENTAGTLNLFQEPFGQNGKTEIDTNLEKGGSLPHPRVFDIHKIELYVDPGRSARAVGLHANEALANQIAAFVQSIKRFLYSTSFVLKVGEKNYIECPSFLLPSNNMLEGGVVGAQPISGTFANGLRAVFAQSIGMEFSILKRRIRLLPDQTFRGYLNFHNSGVCAAGVNAGHVIYCYLHGLGYREVQ